MRLSPTLLLLLAAPAASAAAQVRTTLVAVESQSVDILSGANREDNTITISRDGQGGAVDGWIRFDLSSLPAGSVLLRATLRSYHSAGEGSPGGDPRVRVHLLTGDDWSRTTSDPPQPPGPALSAAEEGFPDQDLQKIEWDLDPDAFDFPGEVQDGALSLALHDEGTDAAGSLLQVHGSDPTPAPPELEIEYLEGSGLFLSDVSPSLAGTDNSITIAGATPGATVFVVFSTADGSTAVPGCPGLEVGMGSPIVGGSILADADGEGSFSIFVPPGLQGVSFWLQVVEQTSCRLSNLRFVTYG